MLRIVEALIQNRQCQHFHAMQARQEDTAEVTTYRMIIIHSVITVLANRRTTLKFFSNLIISPEVLKVFSYKTVLVFICLFLMRIVCSQLCLYK